MLARENPFPAEARGTAMCASHMARTHRREALLPTTTIPRDTQVGIEAAEVCEPRAWLPSGILSLRMQPRTPLFDVHSVRVPSPWTRVFGTIPRPSRLPNIPPTELNGWLTDLTSCCRPPSEP